MQIRKLHDGLSVSGQLALGDMGIIAEIGFRSVICNRPDGEAPDQPAWAELEAEAAEQGIETCYIPVTRETIGPETGAQFRDAMAQLPGPVLAFCGSGARSELLATEAGVLTAPGDSNSGGGQGALRHSIVIVGGGAGGISTAASLLARRKGLDIAIVEPNDTHYYQPGWTLVGGGVFSQAQTARPMASVMPKDVRWIRAGAVGYDPANNAVLLDDGQRLEYQWLIVSCGNRLAWEEIEGLESTLGQNGVTSNYRYDLAPYTWRLVSEMDRGCALFTQPPMPIKCAGAPQKAMYLACSAWERRKLLSGIDVQFHNAGAALFGVADYVPALMETVDRYGIGLNMESNLVAVDGPARKATFRQAARDITLDFDMLHVCPPQKGNAVVAGSELADAAGYVEVDQFTLQHARYPNIFGLGDGCSSGNAKTAAAVRQQAPVVAENLLATMDGAALHAGYNGYGSCPLTVERGKIVLAEFTYGGNLAPTFPTWLIDGTRPSRLSWLLKEKLLPPVYWQLMLKGHEVLAGPKSLADLRKPSDQDQGR